MTVKSYLKDLENSLSFPLTSLSVKLEHEIYFFVHIRREWAIEAMVSNENRYVSMAALDSWRSGNSFDLEVDIEAQGK